MTDLRCTLGFHDYRRIRTHVATWRPVWKPNLGIIQVWSTERICQRCGHQDEWARQLPEDGCYITGGDE